MSDLKTTEWAGSLGPDGFRTTHWSVVLAAGAAAAPAAEAALEKLCRTYWYPIYAFVRRRGHPLHDAQDQTQEFFRHFLASEFLQSADRRKGRFRSCGRQSKQVKRTTCGNNLRQINLGVRMYSDDSRDATPSPGAAAAKTNFVRSIRVIRS